MQGTAAIQYYIQRCLMNLEPCVDPSIIPQVEWAWVKNYRVWEANRKVFLYPENYIEPELRDTKTLFFEELEQELLQSDINQESVEAAYIHYLDKFAEVANLKIVGSYLHIDLENYDPSKPDALKKTLYLVGRTDTEPRIFYLREWIADDMGERWLPWEKIDLVINSNFVTPVYAFGKLFIFWTEFTKLKKETDSGETEDAFNTAVKYSYYNLSKEWKQPQSYVELDNELSEADHNQLRWQRLNAQRILDLSSLQNNGNGLPGQEKNALVLQIDELTKLDKDLPRFDMSSMTWEFWVKFINNRPCGWLGSTPPQGHTEEESYLRTSTLIDYDNGGFEVKAIHKVTEIPDYLQKTSASSYVASKTQEALGYVNNGNCANAKSCYQDLLNNSNLNVEFENHDTIRSLIQTAKSSVELWEQKALEAYTARTAANNAWASYNEPGISDEEKARRLAVAQALEGVAVAAEIARDNAWGTAKNDAASANLAAITARDDELAKPKWESKKLILSFKIANQSPIEHEVDYGIWQHIAITLHMDQGSYVFNLYLQGNNIDNRTLVGQSLLTEGGHLVIGVQEANVRDAFTSQMSEFRLWDSLRSSADILTGMSQRLKGSKGLSLCLPLNAVEPNSLMSLVPSDGFDFELPAVNALLEHIAERERLILFYGDRVASLRNNLKDKSFSMVLESRWNRMISDVWLSNVAAFGGAPAKAILHLIEENGLDVDDYATGHETVEDGSVVLPTTYDDTRYILQNLEGRECSLADINNQPGWYILDTGDDDFLARMVISVGGVPRRIPTTTEIMNVEYIASADTGSPQEISVSFNLDDDNPLVAQSPLNIEPFSVGSGKILAAITSDGSKALVASLGGRVETWNLVEGTCLIATECAGSFGSHTVIAITPDAMKAVSASSTTGWWGRQELVLWNLVNGLKMKTLIDESTIFSDWDERQIYLVAVSDDGNIAVSASEDGTLKVWNFGFGFDSVNELYGCGGRVRALKIFQNKVIAVSDDGTLRLWDLDRFIPLRILAQNEASTVAMDVTQNGTKAVTLSSSGMLKIWDLNVDPELGRSIKLKFERLNTYAFHQLSENLLVGGIDKLLSIESQKTEELDFWEEYSPNGAYVSRDLNSIPSTIDFKGAQRIYFEEIFFHIPFLIANNLNSNQKFEEAQRWYHYIFNPTASDEGSAQGRDKDRYWRYLPFRDDSFRSLKTLPTDEKALAAYREDPFDPHAIAALRMTAYKKAVVMKYIDNLLDWGDSLFMEDSRESINEALGLYVMAYDLLGPRPKVKTIKRFQDIGTYEDFIEDYLEASEFLTAVEKVVPISGGAAVLNPHSNIITDFCVPENEKFIGYWDLVEDRLYKIRHSLNFEGTFRQLDLFAPPIEPSDLVRSVAMGSGISGALADLNIAVPHYRYAFVVAMAKETASNVISLGSSLLDALEKRDAERLANLQNTQEWQILDMMTKNKDREIEEAKKEKAALEESRSSILDKKNYYEGLYNENWSGHEIGAYVLSNLSLLGYPVDIAFRITKAVLALAETEVEVGFSGIGPHNVIKKKVIGPDTAEAIGEATEAGTELLQQIAELIEKAGERIRRRAEWEFERNQAQSEYDEIGIQIEIAQSQIEKAQRELVIHNKTIQHNQEIAYFYRSKFSSEELYNWMVGRLSSLYFQAYKVAYDMAKSAEKSLQYELASTDTYITSTHWDGLRKGLLAGESLMLQIDQMEKSHMAQDSCFLQIEKTISISRTFPGALLLLMAKGACEFQLKEEIFDRDYPGHYFRVIKTIELTVVTSRQLEPYQPVNVTLIQLGNKTLLKPDKGAVSYLLGQSSAVQPDSGTLRVNWRANQQVAVSRVNERDGGMFALDFIFDNKYFPFEGTGVISSWRLEIPKASNPDLVVTSGSVSTLDIQDVLIHIRYTAKSDRGSFKKEVERLLGIK